MGIRGGDGVRGAMIGLGMGGWMAWVRGKLDLGMGGYAGNIL